MSSELARREMDRFLGNPHPEVLSVSGRWGVGKTFGWHAALNAARGRPPLARYAYVSAFGVRSLDELKTAVFQATVRLDRPDIRPTIQSFKENLDSLEGLGSLVERGGRRGAKLVQSIVSALPWAGQAGELLLPSASLLIKNQIVCIDDLERAGEGLDISDILGFVSSLREHKNCKVVLLLNEEGLGEDAARYRTYLEKVVDQAVEYTPTPQESAAVALNPEYEIENKLGQRTSTLGITNIRIIMRLRRFLLHLEPVVAGLNPSVMENVIGSVALLGWSVFEPNLAPPLDFIRGRSDFGMVLQQAEPTPDEAAWNALLQVYGFSHMDELDVAILEGLEAGAFDVERVRKEAEVQSAQFDNAEARAAIQAPWDIYGGSFDDNATEIVEALIASVHSHGDAMSPGDLDNVLSVVTELQGEDATANLIDIYMNQQGQRTREFFDLARHHALRREIAPAIKQAFDTRLAEMPLQRDPIQILVGIEENGSWNSSDVDFLASLSVDDYYKMLKEAKGDDLRNIIRAALRFGQMQGTGEADKEVARKTREALRRIGNESQLNKMRVSPYLPAEEG
ncbi:MAG: hypothetical protein AB7O91_07765 [Sphingomonas sp.]